MRYALVSPQDTVDRLDSSVDPDVQTKPGWRWLPCPPVARPAVDFATQVLEGPTYTVGVSDVTEAWSVRAKTQQELDAWKDAVVSTMDYVLLRIAFNHENRIRALEGKASITVEQFKTGVKALL